MAALNFPASPSLNDVYSANGGSWTWDGEAWIGSQTLSVPYGGTGLTSYSTGDMLYASGATTLAKRVLGTEGQVLTAGATSPSWGPVAGGVF